MKKDFFKHSFLYSISGLLLRGIGILLVPLYTRVFNPDDYGVIDWLATIGAVLGALLPLQVTQAVARFYPEAESEEAKKKIASTALWFSLLMRTLPLLAFVLATDFFSDLILNDKASRDLLLLWGLSIVIGGFTQSNANLLKWTLQAEKRVKVSIVSASGSIIGVIIFVLGLDWGLEGVFMGRIVGGFPGMVLGGYLCRDFYRFHMEASQLRSMLRYSFPLIFTSISVLLMSYADRIFIKVFLDYHELGLYGVGYRFSSISGLFFTGIAHAVTPLVFHHYKAQETPGKIADLFRYTLLIGGFLVLIFTFFSREAITLLATENYLSGSRFVAFLVGANILSLLYVFFPGMEIAKRTDLVTYVFVAGAAVNVLLNYVLINLYGAVGVAIGTLIAAVFNIALRFYLSQRFYPIPFKWPGLLGWFLFCILLIVLFQNFLNDQQGVIGILIKTIVLVVVAVLVIATNLIKRTELRALRKIMIKK